MGVSSTIPPRVQTTVVDVRSILTRCDGDLAGVSSNSLNPYRGCALGNALCDVGRDAGNA